MSSNVFDAAVTVVFVGYCLSKYVALVLIRRLRDQHAGLWSELGKPQLWQLLVTTFGNWRLTAFIWSTDPTNTGDQEIVACVWAIRVLALVVFATTMAIIASVFGWHG